MLPILLIVGASIALMLARPGKVPEAAWVCGGAALLVALGLMPAAAAAHAVRQGLDVYLFLIGMMLLSELGREYGVFDWLAAAAVRRARGSCVRLFALIYLAGMAVTVFMSNDATAVVLTPAVIAAMRRAKADPLPCLFACAFIANAASFVLPISNPANLVVYRVGMPPLGRWLLAFTVPSLAAVAVTYLVLRWVFRTRLAGRCETQADDAPLAPGGSWVIAGLVATAAVLMAASALNWDLGLPTCVCGLAAVLLVSAHRRRNPLPLARHLSWSTLALVAGLFVMVAAVERLGALSLAVRALGAAAAKPSAASPFLVGFPLAVANTIVNNLPLGLLAAATLQAAPGASSLIRHTVLIAVDLGPNLSITGSLATILWLIALRRDRLNVTFGQFLKVGALAMPLALAAALGGLLLMAR